MCDVFINKSGRRRRRGAHTAREGVGRPFAPATRGHPVEHRPRGGGRPACTFLSRSYRPDIDVHVQGTRGNKDAPHVHLAGRARPLRRPLPHRPPLRCVERGLAVVQWLPRHGTEGGVLQDAAKKESRRGKVQDVHCCTHPPQQAALYAGAGCVASWVCGGV
eukprot:SAG25_NODE_253_length_10959_cov_17.097330_10_plen_162_part_00